MESKEQKAFVAWFQSRWPAHAKSIRVSLRGLNFGSGKRAAIMVKHIKAQGSVEGESDIAILLPKGGYGALLIEHKGLGMKHELSEEQADYLGYHNLIGNRAVSTRGLEELKAAVEEYMGL
mgnify:CR=1 FL=1|tara:strand:+ start:24267 stop:24629 length:363 start_codon:yes stop_codon:yes gene_type:complete